MVYTRNRMYEIYSENNLISLNFTDTYVAKTFNIFPLFHVCARCQIISCFSRNCKLNLLTSTVRRLLKFLCATHRFLLKNDSLAFSLVYWFYFLIFAKASCFRHQKLYRTSLRAAIYFWVKLKKKKKFLGRFKSEMYSRKTRSIEWKEISKAIRYTFFKLKWNIIFEKFSVTNGNPQSQQFNVCHAVKYSVWYKVTCKLLAGITLLKQSLIVRRNGKTFFMLEELYSCTNILHTKRETFLAYNFWNHFFYWKSLCNTERNVM